MLNFNAGDASLQTTKFVNLNTSHVKLQHEMNEKATANLKFKYISC